VARASARQAGVRVGDLLELDVTAPAANGVFVARLGELVVFARGTAPGERVVAEVTQVRRNFCRADAVEVLQPSPWRRTPPCAVAGACGGCDFQHLQPDYQRRLKAAVVCEQLERIAGIDWRGEVEAVQPDDLRWRSWMRYAATPDGRPGLRASRSNKVVPLPDDGCLIDACCPPVGQRTVGGRSFKVDADAFWQPHVAAPEVLTRAVVEGLSPRPGERALDLYCGVGLFSAALARAGCLVEGVENNLRAVECAAENVPTAVFQCADVADHLSGRRDGAELVVLDPPRAGAGRAVAADIARLARRALAYVSCDAATFARDAAALQANGCRLDDLRAFDLFPNTRHVELVAIFTGPGCA
jgi:tRNA/tmRNA/rRNA uracil-C5-methylase (TrmA/RlmC/RlmD family)